MRKALVTAGIAALGLAQLALIGVPGTSAETSLVPARPLTGQVVLIAQNEELDVYDVDKGQLRAQPLVKKTDWVNGPPCFVPGDKQGRFVEADDNPRDLGTDGVAFDGEKVPFFGVFTKDGTRDYAAPYGLTQGRIGAEVRIMRPDGTGALVPTAMEDPAGCTFDPATKNLFAVDVGYNRDFGNGDGALIEFFYDPSATTHYARSCVLDAKLSQPGMPAFDGNTLYLPETGGGTIWRYANLPASACDTTSLAKTQWATAAATGIATPGAIVRNPASNGGGWAVSSVLAPAGVFQLSDEGTLVRPLVTPASDTGAPFGFGFDRNNDLFYADLGLKVLPNATAGGDPTDPLADAEDGRGALRWVKGGISTPTPRPLVTGWSYPDGVTIVAASAISQKDTSLVSCDWATFGRDLNRSFAPAGACSGLDAGNVATLTPKWYFPTAAPVTAQPAVVTDPTTGRPTLYVGASDGTFYALDRLDLPVPTTRWTFKVRDPNVVDYGVITSSATVTTVAGQRVVVFGGAATLFVLNADTGALLRALCFDPKDGTEHECTTANGNTVEIESSPAVVPDGANAAQIFVGMDYNEDENVGPAGLISVRLSRDGRGWHLKPQWKYDPEALTTYTASSTVNPLTVNVGNGAGCGNVWSSPAVDTARQLVVFGVGNCDPQTQPRPQVNGTWIQESIVGLRYDGSTVFRYAPHDLTGADADPDIDFGATPNVMIDGTVGEAGKDGCYHALTPAGLLAWPHDPVCVATRSDVGGMIGSTALGMANGQPAVFAASAIPFSTRDPQRSFDQNTTTPNTAFGLHAIRTSGSSLVDENNADDPSDDGTVQWDAPAPPAYGAVVYTGNMVLVPDTFGMSMQAYDADTGALLWSYPLAGAPASPPALLGDSMYFGSGTPSADAPPMNYVGGIWAFRLPPVG